MGAAGNAEIGHFATAPSSMYMIQRILVWFGITLFLAPAPLLAYPLAERLPGSGGVPLDVLSAQPDGAFVPTFGAFADRYLITWSSDTLTLISLELWAEETTQPEAFDDSIVDVALLSNGVSLVVALTGGDVARIELDDEDTWENTENDDEDEDSDETPLDSRSIESSADMTSAGITAMIADLTSDGETVWMINSAGYFYELDLETETLTEVDFNSSSSDEDEDDDTTTTTYTLTDMAFAESDGGDKVLITTDAGTVFIADAGSTSFTSYDLTVRDDDEESPALSQLAITPDGNYAFLLDTTNDLIWVFSVESEDFVDQSTDNSSVDPISVSSDDNSGFTDITIFDVPDEDTVIAYVSGSSGVSLIDASDAGEKSSDSKVIDLDTSTEDTDDPMVLTGTPGPLITTSATDGYVFSANGDATISVITDNPFVTISAASSETLTESASTFTLTFQSDEVGTYTVRANSDPTGTDGVELIAVTALDTADTDVTTATIDISAFDRENFAEGANRIFVFVTDAEGFTGRDAFDITVDRPPGAITITGVTFGNSKAYVSFEQSTDEDIASYTFIAEPAADQSDPECPGSLLFTGDSIITSSVSPSDCAATECLAQIPELSNNTYYCVAMYATDESDQVGAMSAFTTAVLPEQTVGPAAFLGETGCSLIWRGVNTDTLSFSALLPLAGLLLLWQMKTRKIQGPSRPHSWAWLGMMLLLPLSAQADRSIDVGRVRSANDSNDITLEIKGSLWMPLDSGTSQFFSLCCNPQGEIEVGWLHKKRYNITATVGFSWSGGSAVGLTTGRTSGDNFDLFTIPLRLDFVYRLHFQDQQFVVPYARAGVDAVVFIEKDPDQVIRGTKFGVHGAAGLSFLLSKVDQAQSMDIDFGVNGVYLTVEGRYSQINSFKSSGLDLSGFSPYVGVMFDF